MLSTSAASERGGAESFCPCVSVVPCDQETAGERERDGERERKTGLHVSFPTQVPLAVRYSVSIELRSAVEHLPACLSKQHRPWTAVRCCPLPLVASLSPASRTTPSKKPKKRGTTRIPVPVAHTHTQLLLCARLANILSRRPPSSITTKYCAV